MTPADQMAPAGITWEMAMANAGEMLSDIPADPRKFARRRDSFNACEAAAAQAWIAFARELTMHSRAEQSGRSRT